VAQRGLQPWPSAQQIARISPHAISISMRANQRRQRSPPGTQVGAAAAHMDCGMLAWGRMWGLVFGAICVIAWLNLR
jgi:hypothetical protein